MTDHSTADSDPPTTGLGARLRLARMDAFLDGPSAGSPTSETSELGRLVRRTADIYANAVTDETRTAYARRWHLFERWCNANDLRSLPAEPETAMMYLASIIGEDGAALSTIRGWMAAINRVHREAGFQAPGEDPAMGVFLRGLSRTYPVRVQAQPVSALRIADLRNVCRHLDSLRIDPAATRDAAVLALHHAGVGDGEISRLRWANISWNLDTIRVHLPAVRTDRRDRHISITNGEETADLFEALAAWRKVGSEDPEAVFTQVESSGWRDERPLSSKAIFKIRKSRRAALVIDGGEATTTDMMNLLAGTPSEVLRDKALLLLGFAGAFRRNEVTSLRWSDVRVTDGGLLVHLRRSKTDLGGKGRDVGIPKGASDLTCPVRAVGAWRNRCVEQLGGDASGDNQVFVHVGRSGRITETPLSPEGLTRLVQRRALQANIAGKWGGRSLRAGFISTAADLDIPLEAIARQSRHKTLDSLIRYIRDEPFRRNSAAQVGL